MAWWRSQNLVIVAALALATMLGALAVPSGTPPASPVPATGIATVAAPATPGATPVAITGDLYDAILPDRRADIATETAGRLPLYTIEAALAPPEGNEPATVSGTVQLRYINTTGAPVEALPFRLNPNLRQYDEGRMELGEITVDGRPATPQAPPLHAVPASTPVATPAVAEADLILVRVPLGEQLAPGDEVTVTLDFTTTVPVDPPDGTGLFRYHPDRGAWALAHWYPILAGYDPETGWDVEPPAAWSDLTFSNTALYDVTLTAPEELVLITPGIETGDGADARRFVSGPARDFPIVADPTLVTSSASVDGTEVTVYHAPESAAGAEQVLAWATDALALYNDRFGAYPYTTLDIASVPETVGYEFPEVIWLGEDYVADPEGAGSRPGATELLVAHEVAHQWWYGLVGSNPHRHAFLDEGLAEYSAILYFEETHGAEAARLQVRQGLILPYATMLVSSGDFVVDQPTPSFPDALTYYTTVYRKGGLGFAAIREAIGNDAFFAALDDYVAAMRFEVATPANLLHAFEAASGQSLDATWHLWFETASGRVKIVMEPEGGTPVAAPSG